MSINSKVYLDKAHTSHIQITLEADLVHLPDFAYDFVLAVYAQWRAFEKARREKEAEGES